MRKALVKKSANAAITEKKTKKGSRKVQAKRFLWSNDLHMRFLMAMFDWGLSKITPKLIFDELTDIPGLSVGDVEEYINCFKEKVKRNSVIVGFRMPKDGSGSTWRRRTRSSSRIQPFIDVTTDHRSNVSSCLPRRGAH